MKILMCGNDNVYRGILLCALSLAKNTKRRIELYVGTMDLTDIDERYRPITKEMTERVETALKRSNGESTVTLLDFTESFRRELIDSKNLGTAYTPYTMVRLFADEIEEISDKLLYLDTDVMASGDISELYDTDIEGYHLAGVRDYFGKFFFSPRYLNAGVLLFNMKKMREDDTFKKCRKLCNDKKMLLSDQHAINKFAKRKLILNRRFNEQKKSKKRTVVRHFAMTIKWLPLFHTENIKPWHSELVQTKLRDHSFDDVFAEYERFISETEKLKG